MNLALRASVSRRWKESVVREGGGKKFAQKTPHHTHFISATVRFNVVRFTTQFKIIHT